MSRAVYPFALCLTLGLLATMWLRPGLAQEWLERASRIRAQSPDRYSAPDRQSAPPSAAGAPPTDPFAQVPYDSITRPPVQPMPVSQPTNWPGSTAPTSVAAPMPGAAPSTNANPAPGVGVWDPAGRYTPANSAAPPTASQPPAESVPLAQPPNFAAPASASQGLQFPTVPDLGAQNLQVYPSAPKELPDAQTAAKIGDATIIMIADLKAMASDTLFKMGKTVPPELMDEAYKQAYRPLLKQLVETKLIYNDALHTIPKEALPKIEADLNTEFDKKILPKLLESHQASSVQELDAKMRARGSSLDFTRRSSFEKNMAQGWLQQKIKFNQEIPISDVIGYYQSHLADYEFQAKARWEELFVAFDRFPDKAAAWAAIAQMGTAIQHGQPFADVAKTGSQGITASEGGQWDWTTKGSLSTKLIDEAIFNLPVGALSQIFETERGFHIVRVNERTEAGKKDFIDIQPEIKKQLKQERLQKEIEGYLKGIREKTPVWTMFDNEPGGLEGIKEERRSVFE